MLRLNEYNGIKPRFDKAVFDSIVSSDMFIVQRTPNTSFMYSLTSMLELDKYKAFRDVETLYQTKVSKPCYWQPGFVYLFLSNSKVYLPFVNQ